jgi:hypothetical protein
MYLITMWKYKLKISYLLKVNIYMVVYFFFVEFCICTGANGSS